MTWTSKFTTDLYENEENPKQVEFLIMTRPVFFGLNYFKNPSIDETKSRGWSTLPVEEVGNIDQSGIPAWNMRSMSPLWNSGMGGTLISYRETAQSVALRTWKPKASTFEFEVLDKHDTKSEI